MDEMANKGSKANPGPTPQRLKIMGGWEKAVGAALTVKRPTKPKKKTGKKKPA
jgi:hypothetical protein